MMEERMSPAAAAACLQKESGTLWWGCPSSLSLLLPNTKLTSTPTQQYGRPCLRDWSHTAGDTDPSGAAGLRAAVGEWGRDETITGGEPARRDQIVRRW